MLRHHPFNRRLLPIIARSWLNVAPISVTVDTKLVSDYDHHPSSTVLDSSKCDSGRVAVDLIPASFPSLFIFALRSRHRSSRELLQMDLEVIYVE